jgi:hypothetical protein
LRTDGDFCDTEIAQKYLRLSKPINMTIHWKALDEHFLMVPFILGGNAFSEFSPKTSALRGQHCPNTKELNISTIRATVHHHHKYATGSISRC